MAQKEQNPWVKVVIFVIALAAVLIGGKYGVDMTKAITDARVIADQVEGATGDEPQDAVE